MKNHLHLLVKIDNDKIGTFMRKVGAKYVYWYNWKYNRVGGLFQDRYRSETVEDDEYFFTVLRYIHQNLVKTGICKIASEYKDSSYNDYITTKENQLTDTGFVLEMMSKEQFIRFNNEPNNDKCLEIEDTVRINDNEAKKIIYKISKCNSTAEFQALDVKARDKCLKELKEKGLSIRQIERLTGINRGLVLKI